MNKSRRSSDRRLLDVRVSGVRVCTCQKRDSAISVQILCMEENAIGTQGVAKMQTSKHGGLMMECLA